MIRLDAVRRVYGTGAAASTALAGISLEVGRGEFVAVAGPSGSGKTTFLNLVGALDVPSSGKVLLDGRDLAGLGETERARLRLETIGFVFQQFSLIPVLSAEENVELPLLFRKGFAAAERRRAVARALERVGLTGKSRRRPSELSGGEQQRVAVARAVAGAPALLIADEPTANLDHETGGGVIRLLHELNRESGTTLLYATHDPELIGLAGRVITLRDGRLVEAQG